MLVSYSKKQVNLILIALAFLTRIPIKFGLDFSQENLNRASRYFSLVGWLVGGIVSLVFYLANQLFEPNIALLMSMFVSLMLTGCFHEDGLVDTCDGFGGGWTTQQKLAIMKDSRIGTYGAAGLWMVLMFKYHALLQTPSIIIALLVAHPISRSLSTCMIYFLPYVTDEQQAKVKPLAEKQHLSDFMISLFFGLIGLLLIPQQAAAVVVSLLILFIALRWLFTRQIEGFTGDALGACQQISEVVVYLMLGMTGLGMSGALI
jgi:adenosylcobinamide-GDP ribazoletransferase